MTIDTLIVSATVINDNDSRMTVEYIKLHINIFKKREIYLDNAKVFIYSQVKTQLMSQSTTHHHKPKEYIW